MKALFVWLIDKYQKTPLSSHSACVFLPTCSEYTKQAIEKYGVLKGTYLGFVRILHCHPWQKSKYDPLL